MTSAAFERFRFRFFEDPDSPRNGLDMAALAALEGEERSLAVCCFNICPTRAA
jgi:hypothetical protein